MEGMMITLNQSRSDSQPTKNPLDLSSIISVLREKYDKSIPIDHLKPSLPMSRYTLEVL